LQRKIIKLENELEDIKSSTNEPTTDDNAFSAITESSYFSSAKKRMLWSWVPYILMFFLFWGETANNSINHFNAVFYPLNIVMSSGDRLSMSVYYLVSLRGI
jgi:hypothetical protein